MKTESKVSRDIRILAEVEKIWIIYDLNSDNCLNFPEVKLYLEDMVADGLKLGDEEINRIFKEMDTNDDEKISKTEMFEFLVNLSNH